MAVRKTAETAPKGEDLTKRTTPSLKAQAAFRPVTQNPRLFAGSARGSKGSLLIPNPGIQKAIGHVNQEVHHGKD
jgi:hypothetical protein